MGLEDLEEELSCAVCFETLAQPKTLPCLHSFCRDCLVEIAGFEGSVALACPSCRKPSGIPAGGDVDTLPSNFHLINLIERMEAMKQSQAAEAAPIPYEAPSYASPINLVKSMPPSALSSVPFPSLSSGVQSSGRPQATPSEWQQRVVNPIRFVAQTGVGPPFDL